ncbi:MAG: hemolysin family protein [Candidatus Binatia bacterium]
MSDIGLEILIIFILIFAGGVFTMSEIALVAARKSRLQELADKGNTRARRALELAKAPNRFLMTMQIGITFFVILASVFGARTIAEQLEAYFDTFPILRPYSELMGLSIVIAGVTYLSLVIGGLIPKRLAVSHPEGIAVLVAVPMQILSWIFSPLARLSIASTDAVFRLSGKRPPEEPTVTEEEIRTLVEKGTEAGVFEESEQDMVEAVFSLGDRSARSLMTPRTQIVWLDINDSIEENRQKLAESGHSRFPVSAADLDHVMGVVQAKDLLANSLAGKPLNIQGLLQQPLFVPRSVSALQVLESFKQSGKHIALVVDEYGGIEGLLTHHDILEAIAGDIPFSEKHAEPKAVQRQDGSWLLDGMLPVEEFKEIFHLESLPGEKKDAYQTLGGFVFTQMGRIPSVAERFEWGSLRFEIVDMDGKRIDKVLVTSVQTNATGNAGEPAVAAPREGQ